MCSRKSNSQYIFHILKYIFQKVYLYSKMLNLEYIFHILE